MKDETVKCEILDRIEMWTKNDNFHREDGPARIWLDEDYEEWWVDGRLHRLDGPARIWKDRLYEWWVNGLYLGDNDKGFEAIWNILNDEEKENVNLLKYIPGVSKWIPGYPA
jgi:hypothetical protein